jgi:hypothetical protein
MIEAGICLFPAGLVLLMTAVSFLMMFSPEGVEEIWKSQLEAGLFLLVGGAGVVGACCMLMFVMDGRQTISRAAMAACCIAGLAVSAAASIDAIRHETPVPFLVLPLAPFLFGLHLLYMGRAYFKA